MSDATEDQPETPEQTALLLKMAMSVPAQGQYTAMDRYRDYRKVFLGSEDGQRVLRDLLAWGHMFKSSFDKDAGVMAFKEGERNLALRILLTVSREPRGDLPTKANNRPPEAWDSHARAPDRRRSSKPSHLRPGNG